jgi:hypothetical protein
MIGVMDPERADASSLVGNEPRAPVVAVLVPAVKKAVESIAAPKGHGPRSLRLFPCKMGSRPGDRREVPGSPSWTLGAPPLKPVARARPPPLWQYFARLLKRTSRSLPPEGLGAGAHPHFPKKTDSPWGSRARGSE